MAMEQIPCFYCGDFFDPSSRQKNQSACKKVKCQRAKKAARQRHKLKTDPIYAANQKSSRQQWVNARIGGQIGSKKTIIKANPGPTSFCNDYILQRP